MWIKVRSWETNLRNWKIFELLPRGMWTTSLSWLRSICQSVCKRYQLRGSAEKDMGTAGIDWCFLFIPPPAPFLVAFVFFTFTFCNATYLFPFPSSLSSHLLGSPPSLFPLSHHSLVFDPDPSLDTNLREINYLIFIFVVNSNNLKQHSRTPSVIEQEDIAAARNNLKATRPIEWVLQQIGYLL